MAIQVLLDSQPGPLPLKGQFQPEGDVVPSIYFCGTAQSSTPNTTCQVELAIYDAQGQLAAFTSSAVWSTEAKQHKTMLGLFVNQKPFIFGATYSYTVVISSPTTIADANDFYSLTIEY